MQCGSSFCLPGAVIAVPPAQGSFASARKPPNESPTAPRSFPTRCGRVPRRHADQPSNWVVGAIRREQAPTRERGRTAQGVKQQEGRAPVVRGKRQGT